MTVLNQIPLLSLITLVPLAGMVIVLFFLRDDRQIKRFALAVSLVPLVLAIALWLGYDRSVGGFQFEEWQPWIPGIGVNYHLGVDGFSVPLIFLTTLLSVIGLWYSGRTIENRVKEFFSLFLLLETGMLGVFVSLDLVLFYVFWEVGLVPMYFLIGVWGGPRREYAAIKFFLYTLAGSVLMLLAIIAVAFDTGSFSLVRQGMSSPLLARAQVALAPIPFAQSPTGAAAMLTFLGFFLAFAIKVPSFPFHTWLPDAHVEAPTAGSVILAGVLLKLGTYGFVRVLMPIFPGAFAQFAPVLALLAFLSIVYGALVAMAQWDFKKLIAYSSVNHMGYVTLGLAAAGSIVADPGRAGSALADSRIAAINGASMQMFNHGIITGALFLLVGLIYDQRTHVRDFRELGGGLWRTVPRYGSFLMLAAFASLGLPALAGFVGEFMVFRGAFGVALAGNRSLLVLTALSIAGILVTAAFFLWKVIQMLLLGPQNQRWLGVPDLDAAEVGMLVPLAFFMIFFGVWPLPILELLNSAATTLLQLASPAIALVPWLIP